MKPSGSCLVLVYSLAVVAISLTFVASTEGVVRKSSPLHSAPPPHIHGKTCYVTWSKEKGYQIKVFGVGLKASRPNNLDWIAKAHYQNWVNVTGWAFLEVETKSSWPDDMQATAAGISEGYLTQQLIYYSWKNGMEHYCDDKRDICKHAYKFIQQNWDWVQEHGNNKTAFWHQTNLVMKQIVGIRQGYKMAAKGKNVIPDMDFIMMNIVGDLGDLNAALNPNPNPDPATLMQVGHCSALIKIIEDRDMYFSHVTWANPGSMLRIIKRYNFAYKVTADPKSRMVEAESISFSSYPGMISSLDDFYVLSSGLAVMETTIINYNKDLWVHVQPTNTLFTPFRVMVANRLARNGRVWTKLFSRYNSGTYNNQWMVLDYNFIEPGRPLRDSGVLWVLEQLPGMVVSKDETRVLKKQGYFASYNAPYYKEIFEASGTPQMVNKYGDFFTYESTPRAKIFSRDQGKVEDLESMMMLMRYNDYKHDELSKCECNPPYTAVAAISSRADLNPANGTYPFPLLGHRPSLGTDMKVTNLDLFLLQQFIAISGPTYDPLPPFEWEKSDFRDHPHYGHPPKFEFGPTIHNWKWL